MKKEDGTGGAVYTQQRRQAGLPGMQVRTLNQSMRAIPKPIHPLRGLVLGSSRFGRGRSLPMRLGKCEVVQQSPYPLPNTTTTRLDLAGCNQISDCSSNNVHAYRFNHDHIHCPNIRTLSTFPRIAMSLHNRPKIVDGKKCCRISPTVLKVNQDVDIVIGRSSDFAARRCTNLKIHGFSF